MLETKQNKAIKRLYAEIVSNEILAELTRTKETFEELGSDLTFEQTSSSNSNIVKVEDEHYFACSNTYGTYIKYVEDEIKIYDQLNNIGFTLVVNQSYPNTVGLCTDTLDINELVQVDIRINKVYTNSESNNNYLKNYYENKFIFSSNIIGDNTYNFKTGHITDRKFAGRVINKLITLIKTFNEKKDLELQKNLELLQK